MVSSIFKSRIKKIQKEIKENSSLPYVIFNLKDIMYLTGFSGSNALLVVYPRISYFITDSRYIEYAKKILPDGFKIILQDKKNSEVLLEIFRKESNKKVFFQDSSLMVSELNQFKKELKGIKIEPVEDIVFKERIIKDDTELGILRKAVNITDKCFEHLLGIISPGMTEWDVVIEIDSFYKKNGCRKTSFDPIVASGPGSSMPHYMPSMKKKIKNNESVLIDMGCEYENYNSDLTRTIFVSSVPEKLHIIYEVVKKAQLAAIAAIRPGMKSRDIDKTARDIISEEGFGEYFGHSLGHGVGLDIHESPRIKENDETVLAPGMIITIEPGIYLPGIGGVRIEDIVIVTKKGHEIVTNSSKEIIVI